MHKISKFFLLILVLFVWLYQSGCSNRPDDDASTDLAYQYLSNMVPGIETQDIYIVKTKENNGDTIVVVQAGNMICEMPVLKGRDGWMATGISCNGQYIPEGKEDTGEAPVSSPGDRIGINVSGSSYVNGEAGKMLVIQGAAVNNHPATRSAITIKGNLLDAQGQTLLQQTVFCGNKLDDTALKTMSFAAIEEAMNNQFGDSLSNMKVAAGASIPFTIVFRNLPDGLANINVEVLDSKPGAG